MQLKGVRSTKDLAINGAARMFASPLHVGRPNIGDRANFDALVAGIFDRRWLSNDGPLVQEFEAAICAHLGVAHCVAMCNGTIALEIAIRALDLRGEVIVPSYTFVATAHALQWQEITPVFADIDPRTENIDPESVRRMLTPRTSGILAVHLWGRAAPIEELNAIAEERGLKLLFDASHAFTCTLGQRPLGGFGNCEVFSFHATKFFNTFEGGAVVTNDVELASRMRLMRNFGFAGYDHVVDPGTNGKMTEICAAMGLANLGAIPRFVECNYRNYLAYQDAIKEIEGVTLLPYDGLETNNYQYVVLSIGDKYPITRDRLIDVLHAENILARKYFWPGCHNMEPYRSYYPNAGLLLPVTNATAARVVVMPTGESVSVEQIRAIADIIRIAAT